MSPAEVFQLMEALRPEDKVGKLNRKTFNRLKGVLKNAKPRSTEHKPDSE